MRSAILGTIEIVALAHADRVPLGVGVALYLVEFGKKSKFALAVRYFVDVMTGVPSIVFGLFIYIDARADGSAAPLRRLEGLARAGAADAARRRPAPPRSSCCSCPTSLREAALALGAPRWRVTMRIVLPTALPGLITGAMLAVARAAGETAPLLFTATIVKGIAFNLNERMNSLPVADLQRRRHRPTTQLVQRAWGAALTLVAMILLT